MQSLEIINFPKLPIGASFAVDGEAFIKRGELTYTDVIGMEHYIDPLFDKKLAAIVSPAPAPTPEVNVAVNESAAWVDPVQVDLHGHVVLSDSDVERIARRVKELLAEK
jgi:hypothetical protein